MLLRPGQFVKAQVEVARHENTIVLPKEAVVYEDGAPIAYMVTEAPIEEPIEDEPLKGDREQEDGVKRTDRRTTDKTGCRKKRADGWILRCTGG